MELDVEIVKDRGPTDKYGYTYGNVISSVVSADNDEYVRIRIPHGYTAKAFRDMVRSACRYHKVHITTHIDSNNGYLYVRERRNERE